MASKTSELVTLTKVVKDYMEFCLLEYHVRNWLEANVGEWIKNKNILSDWAVNKEYQAMGGTFTNHPSIQRSLVIGSGWKLVHSYARTSLECCCELFLQLEWSPDVMQLKLKYF
jgi:hypothetical protein